MFLVTSRSVLFIQTKVIEKIKVNLSRSTIFSENRAIYETMRNISRVGQATDDKIIRRMLMACWMPMATGTHSEYVIIIVLPLQQWLHESAWMWRYKYIVYPDEHQCNLYGKNYTSKKIVNWQNLRNKYWKTKYCTCILSKYSESRH